jgi:hypothetical protein
MNKRLFTTDWMNKYGTAHLVKINAVGVDAEEATEKARKILPTDSAGPYRLFEVRQLGIIECE